jgi:hypothetical protein
MEEPMRASLQIAREDPSLEKYLKDNELPRSVLPSNDI